MEDGSDAASVAAVEGPPAPAPVEEDQVVSTHVLVPEAEAEKLRQLSRRTRVAQSEYLREAVEDLLDKYGRRSPESVPPTQDGVEK